MSKPDGMSLPQARDELRLMRGFVLAIVLALLFLASTAYTSVATLMDRVDSTDVMKAVSGDIWSARIASQVAFFVIAQVVLHAAMGGLAWLLGCASAALWPEARAKFGRVIVGWFCLLGAAVLAYNALWYPRTFFGAHYHDAMIARVGPFHAGQLVYGTVAIAAVATLIAGTLAFLAVGLLIGSIARTEEAASAAVNLIVLPMAFLSGVFFPIDDMPGWVQGVASFMPMRHLSTGLLDVLVRDATVGAILVPLAVLLGFAAVVTLVATRVFTWDT